MIIIDIQRTLYRLGFDPGGCDGVDGPKTLAAAQAYLSARNGTPVTLFEREDLYAALIEDGIALPSLVIAKNFTPMHRTKLDLIVIHTAEAPEIHKEATNVANFFAGIGCTAPQASAHYVVDDTQIIQCVLECDEAWHVGHANGNSIGIEHAGYASQTPEQWDDDYSRAGLANSASLVAKLCKRFDIPIVKLSVAELAAGGRGIVGHVDCTNAFSGGYGHVDPGGAFPWDSYVTLVKAVS